MISKSNGNLLLSLVINMSLMDVANDIKDEIGDRFLSFDGIIDGEADPSAPTSTMDDASVKNLKALEKFAEKIIKDNESEMERLCDILKHRTFAEEYHQESKQSLQKLTAVLEEAKTVKTLTKTYRKILGYASEILVDTPEKGDAELKALSQRLTEQHKHDLDRIYHVLQDKLENQSQLLNTIKEAGEDITKFVKKLGSPFRPLPDNDNSKDAEPWKKRAAEGPKP